MIMPFQPTCLHTWCWWRDSIQQPTRDWKSLSIRLDVAYSNLEHNVYGARLYFAFDPRLARYLSICCSKCNGPLILTSVLILLFISISKIIMTLVIWSTSEVTQRRLSLAEPSFSSNQIKLNKLNVLTYLLIYCVHRERGVHSAKSGDFYLCTSCAGEYWPAVPLRAYRSWETSVQQWRVGLRHYRPQGAESDVRCRRSPVCSADSFTCTPFI